MDLEQDLEQAKRIIDDLVWKTRTHTSATLCGAVWRFCNEIFELTGLVRSLRTISASKSPSKSVRSSISSEACSGGTLSKARFMAADHFLPPPAPMNMKLPRALLRDVASCDTENTVVVAALQVFNPKASSSPRTPQPPHHHTITFVANHRCVHV